MIELASSFVFPSGAFVLEIELRNEEITELIHFSLVTGTSASVLRDVIGVSSIRITSLS